MEESERKKYWQPAKECRHEEDILKMEDRLNDEVFLGIIESDEDSEYIWYYMDKDMKLSMLPMLKHGSIKQFEGLTCHIKKINHGDNLFKNGMFYHYDEDGKIWRLEVLWNAEMARIKAALIGFKAEDCWLVEMSTIGRRSKLITIAWRMENDKEMLIMPVFSDIGKFRDPDTGGELKIGEMNPLDLNIGDTFLHNGQLWKVGCDEFGQRISKTTLSISV